MGSNRFWARAAGVVILLVAVLSVFYSRDGVWAIVGIGGALALALGLTLLTKWPAGCDFILRNSRPLLIGGIVFAAVGFTAPLVFAVATPNASDAVINGATGIACGCLLLGSLIATFPSMTRRMQASRTELAILNRKPRPDSKFNAIGEAVAACRSVLAGWAAFIQIAGPWIVVLCITMLGLVWTSNGIGQDRGRATIFLLLLTALVLGGLYVVVPTIVVAWFRWTLEGRLPSTFMALPNRAVLALAWRLWLFLAILGTADSYIGGAVEKWAGPTAGPIVGATTSWVVLIAAIGLASSFALRLPAIAVRDRAFTPTTAMVGGRKLWPGLPVGLILSFAPFVILAIVAGGVFEMWMRPAGSSASKPVLTPLQVLPVAVLLFPIFAAIASGSTLLARAYVQAKAETISA